MVVAARVGLGVAAIVAGYNILSARSFYRVCPFCSAWIAKHLVEVINSM